LTRGEISPRGRAFAHLLFAALIGSAGLDVEAAPHRADAGRPDASWRAGIERQLAEKEYEASRTAEGLQAPNRAQNLRTYFEPWGVRVVDRTAAGRPELVSLRLSGVGRGSKLPGVGAAKIEHRGARVELRRAGLVEWYENRPAGLEQGFTIERRPRGRGPLRLELAFSGTAGRITNGSLELAGASGRRLRYGNLRARDARGRELAARMELAGAGRLRLVVADERAAYPVTIDPLLTGAADTLIEANQSANLGVSVAGAGDVNGDGFGDVIGTLYFDEFESRRGSYIGLLP
jgi:hypothetical protein